MLRLPQTKAKARTLATEGDMMEWISVKDRLPPEEEEILVFFKGWRELALYQSGCFFDSYSKLIRGVTHWMKLGDLPREYMFKKLIGILIDREPNKPLKDFTDEELYSHLDLNETIDTKVLACICSEILRRQIRKVPIED